VKSKVCPVMERYPKVDAVALKNVSLSVVDMDTILAVLKEMKAIKDEAIKTADEDTRWHLELQSMTVNDLYNKIYKQKEEIFKGEY